MRLKFNTSQRRVLQIFYKSGLHATFTCYTRYFFITNRNMPFTVNVERVKLESIFNCFCSIKKLKSQAFEVYHEMRGKCNVFLEVRICTAKNIISHSDLKSVIFGTLYTHKKYHILCICHKKLFYRFKNKFILSKYMF